MKSLKLFLCGKKTRILLLGERKESYLRCIETGNRQPSISRCSGHSQTVKLNKDEWITFLTDPPSSKIRFYALHPLPIQTLWECSFTCTVERRFKGRPSRSTEHGHKHFTRQNSLWRTPARKWLLPRLTLSSTSTRKASFSQSMVSLCCSCRGRSPLPFQQG